MPDIQTQLAPLTSDDFRQDQTRVCTIMAFLIGVFGRNAAFIMNRKNSYTKNYRKIKNVLSYAVYAESEQI